MVNKCCVTGCKSGYYESAKPSELGISFFKFPPDPDLRKEWKKCISKPDSWEATPNSRICSLHFVESDFQLYSTDSKRRRIKARSSEQLLRKKLLPNVVPSIFSTQPILKSSRLVESTSKTDFNEIVTKQCYVKVEDIFPNNPWSVGDASYFLKFCCPECDYQIHMRVNDMC